MVKKQFNSLQVINRIRQPIAEGNNTLSKHQDANRNVLSWVFLFLFFCLFNALLVYAVKLIQEIWSHWKSTRILLSCMNNFISNHQKNQSQKWIHLLFFLFYFWSNSNHQYTICMKQWRCCSGSSLSTTQRKRKN